MNDKHTILLFLYQFYYKPYGFSVLLKTNAKAVVHYSMTRRFFNTICKEREQ